MRSKAFSQYKQELLTNKEVKRAYEELEAQYQVIKELIRYRIDHNITQEQLAQKTGIPKSNISRFESGKHSPTLAMIYRIAAGLGKEIKFTLD